jgi:hypothetical protein
MPRYAIGVAVAAALALSAVGVARDAGNQEEDVDLTLTPPRDPDKEEEDRGVEQARKAVLANVPPKREATELFDLMKAFKVKEKGGLGFGEKTDPRSGLEAKLINLQRTALGPSKEAVKKESKGLIELGYVTLALADLTRPYFHQPAGGKNRKDWDGWLANQKKASRDLIMAVKKEDGKAVAKAAKELLNTCTECHAAFRK